MIELEINYLLKMTPQFESFLKRLARLVGQELRIKKRISVSLVFVGNQKIKKLNRLYRQQNKITDVLSFEGLQEIFICLPQAKQQARKGKTSLKREISWLLIHGLLHLFGYDHQTTKDWLKMTKLQDKILRKALK